MSTIRTDVAVVGAGVAGIHLATQLAKMGMKTYLIDSRAHGSTGAQWVNGVPWHMLNYAGIELNENEIHSGSVDFIAVSPAEHQVLIPNPDLVDVDMRIFGARLLQESISRWGVVFLGGTRVIRGNFVAGRLNSIECSQSGGQKYVSIEANLFIDASGMRGILREQAPVSHGYWRAASSENLGVAAQQVRRVNDIPGAQRFLEKSGAKPGQAISLLGLHGGFSVVRFQFSLDWRTISLLTCSRAHHGAPSGLQLINTFVAKYPFVGAKLFGGARPIPLGRPFSTLVAPGLALLGDSAQQVYASHGSGIGIGLAAASDLARVLSTGTHDIGSMPSLWRYNEQFHRRWGGLLGVADLMRRSTQHLDQESIDWLFSSGISDHQLMGEALAQRPTSLSFASVRKKSFNLLSSPQGRALTGRLMRAPAIDLCAKFYPSFSNSWERDLLHYHNTLERLIN